jgi:hypothetical protein
VAFHHAPDLLRRSVVVDVNVVKDLVNRIGHSDQSGKPPRPTTSQSTQFQPFARPSWRQNSGPERRTYLKEGWITRYKNRRKKARLKVIIPYLRRGSMKSFAVARPTAVRTLRTAPARENRCQN